MQHVSTISYSKGVFTVTASHIFKKPGTYHPTAVIHRRRADQSEPVTDTALVADAVAAAPNSKLEARNSK